MIKHDNQLVKITSNHGPGGFMFFVAYVGAVIYFFNQEPHFWGFVAALFKAIVWPAYLLYHVLQVLHV